MFNLFHIIIALSAAVAIGSPAKAGVADLQAPLCKGIPPVAQVQTPPPTASPRSIAVFRDYSTTNCSGSSFNADYELAPNVCYSLPSLGATLLYITCGQGELQILFLLQQDPLPILL